MTLYDDQARNYDDRAGIPEEAIIDIVEMIEMIDGLTSGKTVLEPGVGTGLITIHLLKAAIEYTGFDRSPEMLEVVRAKVERSGLRARLVVADGNERWPVDDRSIDLVFCARALHHMAAPHVVAELQRVLRPGGSLIVGKVRRPKDSVKSEMRRQMRRILREHGFDARSHDDHTARVFEALVARGAFAAEPSVASRWLTVHSPAESIASWRGKEGLGALVLPDDVKSAVLDEVERWARGRYGDIEREIVQEELFELHAIRTRPQ
jgi:ubiquinone/menaquinone biosynthesis C-methylase UbiE